MFSQAARYMYPRNRTLGNLIRRYNAIVWILRGESLKPGERLGELPLLLDLEVESELPRMAIFWFGGLRWRGDSSWESRLGGSEGARECDFAKEA